MQIPLIHRLSDLQLGFNSLQNPSWFLPKIASSLDGVHSISLAYNFCKWGAVILALVATIGSVINRVAIFIIRFRSKGPSLPSIPLLSNLDDDDYSTSENDDDDDDGTYTSSEFEEDAEDDLAASSSFSGEDEYFGVRGFGYHDDDQLHRGNRRLLTRRRSIGEIFSLSEIASRKSVVKLWDSIGFGLGLDFDDSDFSPEGGVISVDDINEEHSIGSISGRNPPISSISTASQAVVVSARENVSGKLALKIWYTRLRRRRPTVIAEWGPSRGKTVSVESDVVQKIYVRDDGRFGVMVGDMRKVTSPLGNVTEPDDDTWWDADAIIVSDHQ